MAGYHGVQLAVSINGSLNYLFTALHGRHRLLGQHPALGGAALHAVLQGSVPAGDRQAVPEPGGLRVPLHVLQQPNHRLGSQQVGSGQSGAVAEVEGLGGDAGLFQKGFQGLQACLQGADTRDFRSQAAEQHLPIEVAAALDQYPEVVDQRQRLPARQFLLLPVGELPFRTFSSETFRSSRTSIGCRALTRGWPPTGMPRRSREVFR